MLFVSYEYFTNINNKIIILKIKPHLPHLEIESVLSVQQAIHVLDCVNSVKRKNRYVRSLICIILLLLLFFLSSIVLSHILPQTYPLHL